MTDISIQTKITDTGWTFTVEVKEGTSKTSHTVTMSKNDYQSLTQEKCSPEECVRKSFEFLLEREPKESILRSFDITVISQYFPEFARELEKRI